MSHSYSHRRSSPSSRDLPDRRRKDVSYSSQAYNCKYDISPHKDSYYKSRDTSRTTSQRRPINDGNLHESKHKSSRNRGYESPSLYPAAYKDKYDDRQRYSEKYDNGSPHRNVRAVAPYESFSSRAASGEYSSKNVEHNYRSVEKFPAGSSLQKSRKFSSSRDLKDEPSGTSYQERYVIRASGSKSQYYDRDRSSGQTMLPKPRTFSSEPNVHEYHSYSSLHSRSHSGGLKSSDSFGSGRPVCNKLDRYVIGDSVVYGSPGFYPGSNGLVSSYSQVSPSSSEMYLKYPFRESQRRRSRSPSVERSSKRSHSRSPRVAHYPPAPVKRKVPLRYEKPPLLLEPYDQHLPSRASSQTRPSSYGDEPIRERVRLKGSYDPKGPTQESHLEIRKPVYKVPAPKRSEVEDMGRMNRRDAQKYDTRKESPYDREPDKREFVASERRAIPGFVLQESPQFNKKPFNVRYPYGFGNKRLPFIHKGRMSGRLNHPARFARPAMNQNLGRQNRQDRIVDLRQVIESKKRANSRQYLGNSRPITLSGQPRPFLSQRRRMPLPNRPPQPLMSLPEEELLKDKPTSVSQVKQIISFRPSLPTNPRSQILKKYRRIATTKRILARDPSSFQVKSKVEKTSSSSRDQGSSVTKDRERRTHSAETCSLKKRPSSSEKVSKIARRSDTATKKSRPLLKDKREHNRSSSKKV